MAVAGRTGQRRRWIQLHRGDGGRRRVAAQLLLSLLIVLQLVEDRGDEGGRDSGEDSHSRFGSGDVLGFAVAELVRGAAPYRRAALHIWALVGGRHIYVQRDGAGCEAMLRFPVSYGKKTHSVGQFCSISPLLKTNLCLPTYACGSASYVCNNRRDSGGDKASSRQPVQKQGAGDAAKACVLKGAFLDGTG